MNSTKRKVVKFLLADLPKGLIEDSKVQNKKSLAKIIASVWRKLRLKEKSVALIVPEFSTYIKLISVPKIGAQDLNEAVYWQAQEFLPQNIGSMVMDWKYVNKSNGNIEVLVIAMDKEVLTSYVDSVTEAGLLPLVVETPSLSLARVTGEGDKGKLIIYRNFNEVILVATKGQKIFGSSIVGREDYSEISKVAQKMIGHYKSAEIELIKVGGLEFDTRLADELAKLTGKKVEWIKVVLGGIEEDKIQEYLIPIGTQFSDPDEPSNENTINLLPEDLVRKYLKKRLKLQIWSLMLLVSAFVWVSLIASLGTYLYLNQQIAKLGREESSQNLMLGEIAEAGNEIERINLVAEKVSKIVEVSVPVEEVFNNIINAKPDGVVINRYLVDLDKGSIEVSGISADRSSLIEFKQKLEENENFTEVFVPISSLETESNIAYRISFVFVKPDNGKESKM